MGHPLQVHLEKVVVRSDLSRIQVHAPGKIIEVTGMPDGNVLEYLARAKDGTFFLVERPEHTTDSRYLGLHLGMEGALRDAVVSDAGLTSDGWSPIGYRFDSRRYTLTIGNDSFWNGKESSKLTRLFYSFAEQKP